MKLNVNPSAGILVGLASLASSALASAAAINIDFQGDQLGGDWWGSNGTYATTAAAPGTGTTWNGIAYPWNTFAGALVDDQNVASDIEMWTNTGLNHWAPGNVNDVLMGDYAFTTTAFVADTTNLFTIYTDTTNGGSGMALDGSKTYDIYVYTAGDTIGQNSTFQLTHAGGSTTQSVNLTSVFGGTFVEGENYLKFSNVSPLAWTNGYEFRFNWGHDGNGNGAINGLQIVEVIPEPSAALLGGIGMLALLRRRRH
jgi:hypothetical protein